jgi:VEFS-Box of polycomb protein
MVKHEETLEDFTDCTAREIRFMKLWDRFVNQDKPQGYKHLPESLMRFAQTHKPTIEKEHLRPELWKFLLNLKQYNRISNMVVKSVIGVIPWDPAAVKAESPPVSKSPTTKSPPRTPSNARRGAPVPSAVAKTDEGSYCLCKSVWSNGMVACSGENCAVEWYHLNCINLWQKPTGRWVCPVYVVLHVPCRFVFCLGYDFVRGVVANGFRCNSM